MSDIFISYNNEDRLRAQKFAEALGGRGWSVFWDRTIPTGRTWRHTIGKELKEARCVVVLWSKTSVDSDWVLDEAGAAKVRRVLIPVRIDEVELPFGFGSIQTADLLGWDATKPMKEFDPLVADIAALIGPPPAAELALRTAAEALTPAKEETPPSQKLISIPPSSTPAEAIRLASGGGRSENKVGQQHLPEHGAPRALETIPKPSIRETASPPSPAPVHAPKSGHAIKIAPTEPSTRLTNKEQATSSQEFGVAESLLVATFFNGVAVSIYYALVHFNARSEARYLPLILNVLLAFLFAINDAFKGNIKARFVFIFNLLFAICIGIYFNVP